MPLHYRDKPKLGVLDALASMIPLSYALGALAAHDQSDIAGNIRSGASAQASALSKFRMLFKTPKAGASAAALSPADNLRNLACFVENKTHPHLSSLDLSKISSPIECGNQEKQLWAYHIDIDYLANYTIIPLFGEYQLDKKEKLAAPVGFVAIGKKHFDNFLIFKGSQGGLGMASALAGLFGKASPEWNSDMDYTLVKQDKRSPFYINPNIETHRGFTNIFNSVGAQLLAIIKSQELHRKSLIIAGHSLGAAIARIAFVSLTKHLHNMALYAFAAPKVGNVHFEGLHHALAAVHKYLFYIAGDPVVDVCAPAITGNEYRAPFHQHDVSESLMDLPFAAQKVQPNEKHHFDSIEFCIRQHLAQHASPLKNAEVAPPIKIPARIICYTAEPLPGIGHFVETPTANSKPRTLASIQYIPFEVAQHARSGFVVTPAPRPRTPLPAMAACAAPDKTTMDIRPPSPSMLQQFTYEETCYIICHRQYIENQPLIESTMKGAQGFDKLYQHRADEPSHVVLIVMCCILNTLYIQDLHQKRAIYGKVSLLSDLQKNFYDPLTPYFSYLFTPFYQDMLLTWLAQTNYVEPFKRFMRQGLSLD